MLSADMHLVETARDLLAQLPQRKAIPERFLVVTKQNINVKLMDNELQIIL